MVDGEALRACVVSELELRYPLTEKQLLTRVQSRGLNLDLADMRRLLEQDGKFVLAGDRPRCWRLARSADSGTDTCAGCGLEKSSSRFRTVVVADPICFDCEARGRSPVPTAEAVNPWPVHFVGGQAPGGLGKTASRRALGYVEPHEGMVYVTKGGSAYHFREDCEALRSGQAEAIDRGLKLHRVRLVAASKITGDRHPCARCTP